MDAITLLERFRGSLSAMLNPSDTDVAALTKFAEVYGWQYESQDDSVIPDISRPDDRLPAWVGSAGPFVRKSTQHLMRGKYHGFPITIFLLREQMLDPAVLKDMAVEARQRYDAGQTTGIIRIKLPKIFPQILLDSNENDQGIASSVCASYHATQKLVLEGDFAQYFEFYSPIGIHLNTLTILAPNFMEILCEHAGTIDVELYGDELIIMTRRPLYDPDVMTYVLRALDAQLEYFERLLPSWRYTPNVMPFDVLQRTTWQGAEWKVGPWRLSPGQVIVLLVAGFIVCGALIVAVKLFGR